MNYFSHKECWPLTSFHMNLFCYHLTQGWQKAFGSKTYLKMLTCWRWICEPNDFVVTKKHIFQSHVGSRENVRCSPVCSLISVYKWLTDQQRICLLDMVRTLCIFVCYCGTISCAFQFTFLKTGIPHTALFVCTRFVYRLHQVSFQSENQTIVVEYL